MPGIALDTLEQKRFVQPIFGGIDVRDSAQADLGVDVFGEVQVQAALEHASALDKGFVLRFQLLFADNDSNTLLV